ncbi:MAG TPA: glycosyl hydrolase, partial [Phycisphaerae bacterium]|nr:glycosyl hydrolase [Phycisphaerae bacterium]
GAGAAPAPAPAPEPAAEPAPPVDTSVLWDDKLNSAVSINPPADGGPAWLQYEFAQPVSARAVTLVCPGRGVPYGSIQVSDDGKTFRSIVELPGAEQYRAGTIKTYAFPETTAKFFRVVMNAPAGAPAEVINQTPPTEAGPGSFSVGEFIVHTGARVDLWEEKAGFNFIYEYDKVPTPAVPQTSAIAPSNVVDLTSKMDKDGTLHWDVPPGKWTILRMGYSLTGSQNRPSTPAGQGPEVDKMNAQYVENYFHGYFGPLKKALGPLMGKSLRNVMMDSFEGGMQNWTDDMIAQFKKRRGYDPTPFLPVLTGHVVGNSDESDRFLWDFRRTIADLLAEAHFGTMDKLAHEDGLTISGESYGVSMEIMEDTLLTKKQIDIPMGEFWLGRMHPPPEYVADVRGASSAAHAYGKKIVATESFTGGGYEAPATYKNLADYWFTQGVNRIVIHTSAHQPLDEKPGNIMVGTHVNRNITWAEEANGIMSYFARTCYMLQQGLAVADCAYLLNEGIPSSQSFWGAGLTPACPDGYDYDCVNADVLLNRMKVADDGRIVLPDGMSYRMLILPQVDRMRPELLRKIKELVLGGATILGPKPKLSPSLQGGGQSESDAEVKQLANEIWGDLDGISRNWHYYGKGKVVWGLPPEEVLKDINVPRDTEFSTTLTSNTVWTHRRSGDADIYFVANRSDQPQDIQGRFRVEGKEAEIWHPDTGKAEPASYQIADGMTTVPLHLNQRQSVFVVFRHPAASPTRSIPAPAFATIGEVGGAWDLAFEPNLGAPPSIHLDKLESWTANSEPGIKYFSGTGTYTKTLSAPQDWFKNGTRVWLDLGTVRDLAQVSVNGKELPLLWKPPFRVDVTDALKPGDNQLDVKVTNEWSNRIAGDATITEPDKKILGQDRDAAERAAAAGGRGGGRGFGGGGFGGGGFGGRGGGALAPSGLLGPVTILQETNAPATEH